MTLGVLCATHLVFFKHYLSISEHFVASGVTCHMILFMNLIHPLYLLVFQNIRRTDSVYFLYLQEKKLASHKVYV